MPSLPTRCPRPCPGTRSRRSTVRAISTTHDENWRGSTDLAERDEDHLWGTLVYLLEGLALEVALHVRRDDREVVRALSSLLLLVPVDDVAEREDAGVALHREGCVDLDGAVRRDGRGCEAADDAGVGAGAEGGDLSKEEAERERAAGGSLGVGCVPRGRRSRNACLSAL